MGNGGRSEHLVKYRPSLRMKAQKGGFGGFDPLEGWIPPVNPCFHKRAAKQALYNGNTHSRGGEVLASQVLTGQNPPCGGDNSAVTTSGEWGKYQLLDESKLLNFWCRENLTTSRRG